MPSKKSTRSDLSIRSSDDFTDWVYNLADDQRVPMATLVEQALVHYANAIGYDEPAPQRRQSRRPD